MFIGHRAFGGGADEFGVFNEDAAGYFWRAGFVGGHARGVVGVGDEKAHRVFHSVDLDVIASGRNSGAITEKLAAFQVD